MKDGELVSGGVGAHRDLIKPIEPKVLLSVTQAAMDICLSAREAHRDMQRALRSNQFLLEGKYRIFTMDEVWIGLKEILLNAVEHGNLNMTYDEKTKWMLAGTCQDELQRRQSDPRYSHAYAETHVMRNAE